MPARFGDASPDPLKSLLSAIRGPLQHPGTRTWIAWLLCGVLLAAFLGLRLHFPWTVDYEAATQTIQATAFVERGVWPESTELIRFTNGLVVGPLHVYLKALPHIFSRDPAGEILLLNLLNM